MFEPIPFSEVDKSHSESWFALRTVGCCANDGNKMCREDNDLVIVTDTFHPRSKHYRCRVHLDDRFDAVVGYPAELPIGQLGHEIIVYRMVNPLVQ